MQFQGRELRVGDKLVSKEHGDIEVDGITCRFSATTENGVRREWECTGRLDAQRCPGIDATWPGSTRKLPTYEKIIKQAVDKFLGWQLPEDFCPDGGISFEPVGNAGTTYEFPRGPVGTNLFSSEQAEAMFRACIPRGDGSAIAPDPAPDREAEYRRIWIERACVAFDGDAPNANPTDSAVYAFDAADAFIAELRKRDQEGK